jgi:hypothetical protein
MAINIPINTGGIITTTSATGSFGGMLALASGSSAVTVTGLKYISGYTVNNPGTPNANYIPTEVTYSTPFTMASGTKIELLITSCSLAAGSAPVVLYS